MAAGFFTLPEWAVYGLFGGIIFSVIINFILFSSMRSNPLVGIFLKAQRGNKRVAMVHYPSGQAEFIIPEKVEEDYGDNSPVYKIKGTVRFKDATGEKWESVENIKVLHYTARCPTPLGVEQFISIDYLADMLSTLGFTLKHQIKDVFFLINESAKGESAEFEAWQKLNHLDKITKNKIAEIIHYIKANPDIRYVFNRTGAFTYQTAVSVVDQILHTTVFNTSDMISFIEDKTRRKMADKFGDLAKYAAIMVPILIAGGIAAATLLAVYSQGG